MNYINKLASFAVLVTALSGCDFNEDFCIRNGELVAWCDFSGIKEPLPIPAQRHMIAFPPAYGYPFRYGNGLYTGYPSLEYSPR